MSTTATSEPDDLTRTASEELLRRQRFNHDLRQSLTVVMSLVSVVEQSMSRKPEVLRRLEQIRSETDWMTTLVSSSGPRATDTEVVDVGEIVSDAWSAAASTCHCSLQLLREALALAGVDRVELARSVRNLIDNALRAAGDDGSVVVQVRTEQDSVAVTVRDTGPGFGNIPTQHGLGLLTVRRFATENGGRLVVQQSLLGGTEMTLWLPRAEVSPLPNGGVRCG